MLDEKELEQLNHLIKEIYSVKTSFLMRKKLLEGLKALVKFNLASFSLGVLKAKKIYLVDSAIVSGFEKTFEDNFLFLSETQYDMLDYASWIFQIPQSVVYKDSEVMDNELRKQTPYYKDYLIKYGLPNVAGVSIVKEEKFLGALTLFKNEQSGDFSGRDMFILRLLTPHLENRLACDEENTPDNKKNVSYALHSRYHLTSREVEIIGLMFKGKTNEEVAQELVISEYTVKKHVSNIYEKLQLSNRMQLMQFIQEYEVSDLWR